VRHFGTGSTHGRDKGDDEATPAAEDGEEAQNELGGRQTNSNDERPYHPACNLLVCVETLLEILTKRLLCAGVLELPHGERVEPEAGLGRRAEGDCLLAVDLVTLAVAPQANLVKVLQFLGRCGALEGLEKIVVELDVVREVVDNALGIRSKAACVCLWLLLMGGRRCGHKASSLP
jgi:hypothetical protein